MDRYDSGFEDLIWFLALLIPVSFFTTVLTFIFWFVVKLQSSSGFGDFARQRSLWVYFETLKVDFWVSHTLVLQDDLQSQRISIWRVGNETTFMQTGPFQTQTDLTTFQWVHFSVETFLRYSRKNLFQTSFFLIWKSPKARSANVFRVCRCVPVLCICRFLIV